MLMCSAGFRLKVCFCVHCFNSSLWILKLIIRCLFVSFTVYSNCFVVLFLRFVKLWRLLKLMQGPFDIFIVYMLISERLVFVCNVQRKREREKTMPCSLFTAVCSGKHRKEGKIRGDKWRGGGMNIHKPEDQNQQTRRILLKGTVWIVLWLWTVSI